MPVSYHSTCEETIINANFLSAALSVAVPLHIYELRLSGGPTDADIIACRAFADDLGSHGDVLLFGSKKKGETADLFNRLARAIAVLSFCPGGVHLFGEHWTSTPT